MAHPARSLLLLFAASLLAAACGTTTTGADVADAADATIDVATPTDAPSDMGAVDATAVTDAMTCDAGGAPGTLPSVTSTFVILDGDAGSEPTPSGGDPIGNWAVRHVTFYLPAAAAGQVFPDTSSITGTGFTAIDATTYRQQFDFMIVLDTAAVGTVRQGVLIRSYGTYTQDGANLMLMPVCAEGRGSGAGTVGFSRDAPDRGRLFVHLSGMGGTSLMVMDLDRLP